MPLRSSLKALFATPLAWCILVWLFDCSPAQAQNLILHLRNGDRITGRFLSDSTNGVVIKTAFSEKLTVPAALIEKRETVPEVKPAAAKKPPVASTNRPGPGVTPASGVVGELILTNRPSMAQTAGGAARSAEGETPRKKPPVTEAAKAPAAAPDAAKPAAQAVAATPAESAPAAAKPETAAVKPPETAAAKAPEPAKPAEPAKPPEPSAFAKFIKEWNGEAQIGANLGFGTKDREAFTSRIKVTHNRNFSDNRSLRNILEYDMAYGTTDSVLSDNRMEGAWKVDYDLNKRFLLYNAFRSGYNEIGGIDFQYDFGPGLGYKWLVLTNFVFKNELGGDYQEQFFADNHRTERYSLRVAEDMWWQITPKIRWDEKIEFFPAVNDFNDYRIRLETNLSYLLKQNLTLTLNVVDLYDTSVPKGVSKNDLQIRSLLGVKF